MGTRPFLAILGLAAIVAACGPDRGAGSGHASDADAAPADDRKIRVTDAEGRTVVLAAPPDRIVSLVPSATETILALGEAQRMVGRTRYDTVPPLDTLPSVGGGLEPSVERIVSLRPDLVVRFAGRSDRDTPARLDALDIPHLAIRPDGISDVRGIVRLLGRATRRTEAADSILAAMDSTLAFVAAGVRHRTPRPVAFVLGGSPPWVAGPGTFLDELVTLAGGRNAFSDLDRLYGPVSPETFVARTMELILTVEGSDLDLPVDHVPVRWLPGDIQTPGPDLGESAVELARILHPGALP